MGGGRGRGRKRGGGTGGGGGVGGAGLTCASPGAFATPRRLTLAVEGVRAGTPDVREERKGPRVDAPEKALEGFLRSPRDVLRRYDPPQTIADRVARAVALHRLPDLQGALAAMDDLIRLEPNNPYHHELKGQFLLEAGRAEQAIGSYERALALKPRAPLIAVGLGRSLLALDTPAANARALEILTEARDGAVGTSLALRALALAHARAGNEGYAASVTAERMVLQGRPADAERFATQAAAHLPNGSPEWIRVQDLLQQVRRR